MKRMVGLPLLLAAGTLLAAKPEPKTVEKYLAARVLRWGGSQVSSAEFALSELTALDLAADAAWRGLKSRAEYDAYRKALRAKMLRAVGNFPERTPLNARTVATCARDGYRIEKVIFESMPGVHVTANLFLPDGKGPHPAVVMSCGHSTLGKDCPVYLRACVLAVRQGFAAFMFDPYAQGERRIGIGSTTFHTQMGLRGNLIDWSAPLLRIWDGMRAIDYALSRPEVDSARLGYMGQSGGGTMTALMEAADDRIRVAAPSCFLTSLRALCQQKGPQDGEQNIYGQLGFGLNHTGYVLIPDIPVAVTCKFGDAFPYCGIQSLMATVRETERNVGLGERTLLNRAPGPHGWTEATETASVRFLARHLLPECRDLAIDLPELWQLDIGFDIGRVDLGLAEDERGCTADRSTTNLPHARHIYDIIAERAAMLKTKRPQLDAGARRSAVRDLAKIREPSATGYRCKVAATNELEGVRLTRLVAQDPKTGHYLPAVLLERGASEREPVIAVSRKGRSAAFAHAKGFLDEGHPVLVADLTGCGEIGGEKYLFYKNAARPDEGLGAMCYLMGEPLAGRRATDLLVWADVLAKRLGGRRPLLVAEGELAIPAALARAADPAAWSGVRTVSPPPAWDDAIAAGSRDTSRLCYADIVPGLLLYTDWTELLR